MERLLSSETHGRTLNDLSSLQRAFKKITNMPTAKLRTSVYIPGSLAFLDKEMFFSQNEVCKRLILCKKI